MEGCILLEVWLNTFMHIILLNVMDSRNHYVEPLSQHAREFVGLISYKNYYHSPDKSTGIMITIIVHSRVLYRSYYYWPCASKSTDYCPNCTRSVWLIKWNQGLIDSAPWWNTGLSIMCMCMHWECVHACWEITALSKNPKLSTSMGNNAIIDGITQNSH